MVSSMISRYMWRHPSVSSLRISAAIDSTEANITGPIKTSNSSWLAVVGTFAMRRRQDAIIEWHWPRAKGSETDLRKLTRRLLPSYRLIPVQNFDDRATRSVLQAEFINASNKEVSGNAWMIVEVGILPSGIYSALLAGEIGDCVKGVASAVFSNWIVSIFLH